MQSPTIDQQVTFLYCADLERTARFYQDLFQLDLALDQGSCRIYHVSEHAFVGFCQKADQPPSKDGVILTLVAQDVDGWYRYLSERGAQIEKPPALNPNYNIYHMFLRDPDGYLIEIQRFLDPAWPQKN